MGQPNIHPAVPAIPQPEQIRFYHLLSFPTWDELRFAAYRWDLVAAGTIRYAFGGSFAAIFRDGLVQARDIEIVVEPGSFEQTSRIMADNPQYFGITQHNDHVIVVREDDTFSYGVAIQRFELGIITEGYPNYFIPPYGSRLRNPRLHYDLEPTYYQKGLGFLDDNRLVPVFLSRCLLFQRLCRFQRSRGTIIGQSEKKLLKRDILEIRAFLHLAVYDQDQPFPDEIIPALTPVVRSWIAFAEDHFVDTTLDDVIAWVLLGVQLNPQSDVSARIRGN